MIVATEPTPIERAQVARLILIALILLANGLAARIDSLLSRRAANRRRVRVQIPKRA